MQQWLVPLLGLAALGCAQDSTSSSPASTDDSSAATTSYSSSAPTSTAATNTTSGPITHTVEVAEGGNTFVPDVVLAEAGDTILFQFYPTNHSVIRAEYGYPCIPYEDTGVDKVGFFSGFKPVDAILPDPPTWSLLINDTNPVFYYCGAPGSCINYEMVGVINPNATTSLQHQKDLASQSSFMLLPGEPWPNEETDPFTTTSSAPTSSATESATNSAAAASATSSGAPSHSHSGLSTGAIAGIAIGAAAVGLAAAALLYLCGRQSARKSRNSDHPVDTMQQHHSVAFSPHASMPPYLDPNKHMSMHSSVVGVGSALPGYMPQHEPHMSPPLQPMFPTGDFLISGTGQQQQPAHAPSTSDIATPDRSTYSTSPNQMYSVPAYSSGVGVPQNMVINPTPHHSMPYPPPAPLPMNLHEMAAEPSQSQGGNMPERRSSVSKNGGVERYG
ncbi:hypothetical protein EDD36DRAFT_161798 [Exophiala viscosa]|uniref:Phytocyanin domain-containing protein n=1 Tax=Exophiala viscosa TaxID=2486360 RepID=A0AAN6E558_9EURO|nr:hypothetical protein EDD36DRAFT_161798 [Exophiala viscosa]